MVYLFKALAVLIDVLFSLYIFFLMFRFLSYWARVDVHHPFSRLLFVVTEPPLRPLRPYAPRFGCIDAAPLALMFALQLIKIVLLHLILGLNIGILALLLLAIANLIELALYIYIVSIFIQAILSWFPEMAYNPLNRFLQRFNEPLLRPARRYIPPFEGIDFSPLVVILILYVLLILLVEPLVDIAARL